MVRLLGVPADPTTEPVEAAQPLGGEERGDVPGAPEVGRRHAELARVEPSPAAEAAERRQPVGVVGDLDDARTVVLGAVGSHEAQVERLGTRTDEVGEHRQGGLALGLSVLG